MASALSSSPQSHKPLGLQTHSPLALTQHHALCSMPLHTCPSDCNAPSFLVPCWGYLILEPEALMLPPPPPVILCKQNVSPLLCTPQPCVHPEASLSWGCDFPPLEGGLLKTDGRAVTAPAYGGEAPTGALKVITERTAQSIHCKPLLSETLPHTAQSSLASDLLWPMKWKQVVTCIYSERKSELVLASLPVSPRSFWRVVASQPGSGSEEDDNRLAAPPG